jgi:cyclopropane-fatty-acyl-phospholipid synthase
VFALSLLLRRFIRQGSLVVIDHVGRRHSFGTPGSSPSATVRLTDPTLYRRLTLYPTLHVGRAFTDGTLTVEEGTLADFLNVLWRRAAR